MGDIIGRSGARTGPIFLIENSDHRESLSQREREVPIDFIHHKP
jgi:hypothetical protein